MPSPTKIDWSKVDRPEHVFQRFPSRRSQVYGTKGMIAASQPLAVEVGLEILRKGGNAADAAVATSIALNVTEPTCCGIGGDAFCLFYDAESKTVKALNGSGRSPEKLTIDHLRKQGVMGKKIPLLNLNSVTIPGAAAAWVDTVEKFGSGTLSLSEIFAPAIRLAEEGGANVIDDLQWQRSEEQLKIASPNGDEMLLDGKAPLPGQIMTFPNLAKTLRTVAEEGKDGFYKGRVAQAIVDLVRAQGGVMEMEDLAKHATDFVEPISYTYGGEVTLWECPPNGQGDFFGRTTTMTLTKSIGITALLALGILESMEEQGKIKPLLEMEHNSVEYLHALVEALRLAFADTQYYVTDPDVVHVPVKELLSKEYLSTRAKLFDPKGTDPKVVHTLYTSQVLERQASEHNECRCFSSYFAICSHTEGMRLHPAKPRLRIHPRRRAPKCPE
ncbi:hypothetical protein HWV62_3388, partial [Athelia sp. TMB]